jgi:hypothetical protein
MNTGTITSRICEMASEIQKLTRRLTRIERAQTEIQEQHAAEVVQRQNYEKSNIKEHDTINFRIDNLDKAIHALENKITNDIAKTKFDVLEDVHVKQNKLLQTIQTSSPQQHLQENQQQSHLSQSNEQQYNNNHNNNIRSNHVSISTTRDVNVNADMPNVFNKFNSMFQNEMNNTHNIINSMSIKVEYIETRMKELTAKINTSFVSLQNELSNSKNAIERLQQSKQTTTQNFRDFYDDFTKHVQHLANCESSLNCFIASTNEKHRNYDDILLNHNNNFTLLQNEMNAHFREVNTNLTNKINEIKSITETALTKNNKELDNFEQHFMNEYNSFTSHLQNKLNTFNNNNKKLLQYNNTELDVLKEKHMYMDNTISKMKIELLNNTQ